MKSNGTVNKEALYGTWMKSVNKRQATHELALRKAMDLPVEDDMQVNVQHGITGWQAVAAAAVLAAGLGGGFFMSQRGADAPAPAPVAQTPAVDPVPGQRFRVTFSSDDGTPIEVHDASP